MAGCDSDQDFIESTNSFAILRILSLLIHKLKVFILTYLRLLKFILTMFCHIWNIIFHFL